MPWIVRSPSPHRPNLPPPSLRIPRLSATTSKKKKMIHPPFLFLFTLKIHIHLSVRNWFSNETKRPHLNPYSAASEYFCLDSVWKLGKWRKTGLKILLGCLVPSLGKKRKMKEFIKKKTGRRKWGRKGTPYWLYKGKANISLILFYFPLKTKQRKLIRMLHKKQQVWH